MKANAKKILHVFKQDTHAVSPIVATLMLVLVAAGGAAGVWMWMGGFQEDATQNIGTPSDRVALTIGGSSTVYEFSNNAIEGFEALNKGVDVILEKGGSGAGRKAVCIGTVDIGSSSSPVKSSDFASCPDLNRDGVKDFGSELHVFKVATDGVVFATLASNTHCSTPIQLTQAQAYSLYYHNMDNLGTRLSTATPPGAGADDLDNVTFGGNGDGDVTWDEIPMSGPLGNETCSGSDLVEIFDRKDPGGTSEIAAEKLFGKKGNQLEDEIGQLGDDNQGDGNQGVLDAVKAHTNADHALFFTSFGYAVGQSLDIQEFGKTAATVKAPSSSNIKDETYDATRPILYITAGPPSPIEQLWLDYVMNPHTNQLIAEASDFEHIY